MHSAISARFRVFPLKPRELARRVDVQARHAVDATARKLIELEQTLGQLAALLAPVEQEAAA